MLVDVAGNSTRVAYTLNVKSTTPDVAILDNGSPIAANAIFNRAVTPVVRVNESGSTVTATLNGATFTSGTTIGADGDYSLTATASDSLGHSSTATATFSIDRTPPSVKITAPIDGSTISGDHVEVHVDSSGADSILVNGTTVSGTITMPLDIGANLITAVARDRAGNVASDQVVVTRDDAHSGIVLMAPADNVITNRTVISVAGQVLTPGDGVRVSINGSEVSVDASGAFRVANFPLVEGANIITATLVSASSPAAATAHVTADLTPPQLTVTANGVALQDGDRFAASPSIALQASDDRSNVTTTVTVDGASGDAALQNIATGGHTLVAIARDAAGNETRVERSFVVGSGGAGACVLSDFDPPDRSSLFANSVWLAGRASGASSVTVNGIAASVGDSSFIVQVPLSQEGANPISITCGEASATLTLFRVTGTPSITIEAPARNAILSTDTVTVSGTVGSDVVSGDVNGIPFTPANGTYSVPNVALANGANIITAHARNDAGRAGIATTYVIRPAAPQIVITSPLPSARTGTTAIDVSGVYSNVDPSTIAAGTSALSVHAISDTTGTFISSGVPLSSSGSTTISVTGRSSAGLTATASVDVQSVAGAPSIAIDSPADDTAFGSSQSSVTISGSISASPGAVVQVNGTQVTVDGSNHFSAEVALNSGVMPVIARVSTPDGQNTSDSIRLLRFSSPFSVRDSFPAADATEVDPGVLLVALFTNPVDGSSARSAVTLADAAGQPVGTTIYADNDAISVAPNVPLASGVRYTLTISIALKDWSGSALSQPVTLTFTTSTSAPAVAPVVDQTDTAGCITAATMTGKATVPGARVRLDLDGASRSTTAASDGTFRFDVAFAGASGFHVARIREAGGDGSLSPEATVSYRISCSGPQVLAASLDRAAKRLTIQFSKPVQASTLVAAPGGTILLGSFSGSIALNGSGDTATILYDSDLGTSPLTMTVSKSVLDTTGLPMAADYSQVFTIDGSTQASGQGYVTGAVYDASTGRPLSSAIVNGGATDDRGRYVRMMDEGVYTIEANAP
ncbi:MAG TPA: Ig-like domain-containing protein, partial [Thermoanaerobaculia bacterium]|nr:Ig-like domain-containing protein [Thermoanaerobaculia bacterium]